MFFAYTTVDTDRCDIYVYRRRISPTTPVDGSAISLSRLRMYADCSSSTQSTLLVIHKINTIYNIQRKGNSTEQNTTTFLINYFKYLKSCIYILILISTVSSTGSKNSEFLGKLSLKCLSQLYIWSECFIDWYLKLSKSMFDLRYLVGEPCSGDHGVSHDLKAERTERNSSKKGRPFRFL